MHHPPRLLPLGDAAWTLEFGDAIDPSIHAQVLGFSARLRLEKTTPTTDDSPLKKVLGWVPTFRSVTVYFNPLVTDAKALGLVLLQLASNGETQQVVGKKHTIPICFDAAFAPDLTDVAAWAQCSEAEVVALLTGTEMAVYMLGFLPGFAYMGGLPERLHVPRLAQPRTAVPAQSLAIAAGMCAVYPWQSPGGWRLVGRTPLSLFNSQSTPVTALLAPGDRVQWQAISRSEFVAMEQA